MLRTILFVVVIFISCSSDDVNQKIDLVGNTVVSFENVLTTLNKSDATTATIKFSRATESAGFVTITFAGTAQYETDFTTNPALLNNAIKLDFGVGSTSVSFDITALENNSTEAKSITVSINDASDFLEFNASNKLTVNILESGEVEELLTVVTWNVENFPNNGNTTLNLVQDIINNMDADIIALQEMDDITAFNSLANALPGWDGYLYDVRGGIELAYLFKTSEIVELSNLSIIFEVDRDPFPRQPVVVTAKHITGLEVTLINLHLKCCNDGEARRGNASTLLKDYLDANMADKAVIVLGDYNDDILAGSPFSNFINDGDNYLFTDMEIAQGSNTNWSYPSWPSHIDHIMITDELFDNHLYTETLKLNETVSGYYSNVSDHRPVASTFGN